LSIGRKPFQPARYMYLVDWKETLPASKVVPSQQSEGCISVDTRQQMRMSDSAEKASGYLDAKGAYLISTG
jgi:hypothetical protein